MRPMGQFNSQTRVIRHRRKRVSNKNVAIWIAFGLLYFFFMPIAVLLFVAMFYIGKIKVAFTYKQFLMPSLGVLAISTFFYPQTYMVLRVTTFILFILFFCGRFSFRLK